MQVRYEVISEEDIFLIKDLCNELMAFQKSKANIAPERFDSMSFESRMVPSVKGAKKNYIVIVKDDEEIIGYVYSNICSKGTYSNSFATFFDMESVKKPDVGCLSQFYLKEGYRSFGIGTVLFNMSIDWLKANEDIEDLFIYVSNGNDNALKFYQSKGFKISHQILDGFITVLRND